MKIKKLKIKLNKDNEYSDYRYFIPKSNNIKMIDGRDVDEAVQSLKDKITNLKAQANYLIDKAPLVKYAEGTSIIATGCADAPLRKFSIEGDSYQETREGYNKLNLEKYFYDESESILNGGTVSINNGIITVDATNATENMTVKSKNIIDKAEADILSAGTYYFGVRTNGYYVSNPTTLVQLWDTVTLTEDYILTQWFIPKNMGSSATFKLLLSNDSSKTEYEPYGVIPSMEYESPIESVGDNINELANLVETQIINGVEITKNIDGSLTFNGTATKGINLDLNNKDGKYFKAISGEQYTISLKNNNGLYFRLRKVSENTNIATFDTPSNKTTFTSNYSGSCFAYLVIIEGTTFNKLTIYPKLEKGTKATAYSPYGQGSIEVYNCNKNLFKLYDIEETNRNGLTYSCKNEKITINGIATALTNIWFNNLDIIMNIGEYTLSSNTNLQGKGSVALKDLNGNIVQTNLNTPAKITLNKNTTVTQFLLQIASGATFTNFEMEIQLELGSTATDYIPHQSQTKVLYTQQPFRAIGDVKDRFINKDGVWYEEHSISRKVYKGTESFRVTPNGNKLQIFANDVSNIGKVGSFCNRLKSVNNIWNISEHQDVVKISDNLTAVNIMLKNTEINTVDLLKEKLTTLYNAGTPLYIDYILKTPILIPCTTEQIEILDNLQTYDKITYYNVDKINNTQANIKLIYKQDINAILEEKGV